VYGLASLPWLSGGRSSNVGAGCRLVKGSASDEALSEAAAEPS